MIALSNDQQGPVTPIIAGKKCRTGLTPTKTGMDKVTAIFGEVVYLR
jgi:hypothetical protein